MCQIVFTPVSKVDESPGFLEWIPFLKTGAYFFLKEKVSKKNFKFAPQSPAALGIPAR